MEQKCGEDPLAAEIALTDTPPLVEYTVGQRKSPVALGFVGREASSR